MGLQDHTVPHRWWNSTKPTTPSANMRWVYCLPKHHQEEWRMWGAVHNPVWWPSSKCPSIVGVMKTEGKVFVTMKIFCYIYWQTDAVMCRAASFQLGLPRLFQFCLCCSANHVRILPSSKQHAVGQTVCWCWLVRVKLKKLGQPSSWQYVASMLEALDLIPHTLK